MAVPGPAIAPGPGGPAPPAPPLGEGRSSGWCGWFCCACCGVCTDWRWAVYTLASAVMAAAVVHHAYVTREQFYPAVVFLLSDKISLAVRSAAHR